MLSINDTANDIFFSLQKKFLSLYSYFSSMNKTTPPEAKGVGTNSKLHPKIKGVEISTLELVIFVS